MVHALEMPQAFAGIGVEREQRVCVEVVADPITAVEVHDSGAGRRIENAVLGVDNHACPVVGSAGSFVGIFGPRFVTWLAGQRDSVKDPAQLAGAEVEGLNVTWRRGMRFWLPAADDDHVFVNDTRRGERDRQCAKVGFQAIDNEALSQIDSSIVAKARDKFAGVGVEAKKKIHHGGVDSPVRAVVPVGDSACRLAGDDAGVEFPFELAGRSVERDDLGLRRVGVECPANDERVGLDAAFFAGVVSPRLL
jgi:hypothetical protein